MMQNCVYAPSKCCYLVEFPRSNAVANTLFSSSAFTIVAKTKCIDSQDYSNWNIHQLQAFWIARQKIIPILLAEAAARAAPSFYLCAQHGPPLSSGRSPPIV
jgi:hypothetical protein